MEDRFLDLKNLSKYACLSVKTLREFLPFIPHYRLRGKILIKQSAFDEFIEKFKVEETNIDKVVKETIKSFQDSQI